MIAAVHILLSVPAYRDCLLALAALDLSQMSPVAQTLVSLTMAVQTGRNRHAAF